MKNLSLTGDVGFGGFHRLDLIEFRNKFNGDCYSYSVSGVISENIFDFVGKAQTILKVISEQEPKIDMMEDKTYIITNDFFIIVTTQTNIKNPWKNQEIEITITICGDLYIAKEFHEKFISCIPQRFGLPTIHWNYLVKGQREECPIPLSPAKEIKKEFYPWMQEDPYDYMKRFLDSECGVIILRGEPGTGKTSFVRSLIHLAKTDAMITYEKDLFQSDDMFVEFISSMRCDILVMEDADYLLTSREKDGNTAMSKFLNVADGLIKFPNKKLVITSNIVQENKIDEALLRPGRCFDTPHFRKLTFDEAVNVCNSIKLTIPTNKNDTYTLAELFNNNFERKMKIGFSN